MGIDISPTIGRAAVGVVVDIPDRLHSAALSAPRTDPTRHKPTGPITEVVAEPPQYEDRVVKLISNPQLSSHGRAEHAEPQPSTTLAELPS